MRYSAVVRNRVPRGEDCVITVTAAQVEAARAWALDCEWLDSDQIAELPAGAIVRGVDEHYAGGWAQFVADSEDER